MLGCVSTRQVCHAAHALPAPPGGYCSASREPLRVGGSARPEPPCCSCPHADAAGHAHVGDGASGMRQTGVSARTTRVADAAGMGRRVTRTWRARVCSPVGAAHRTTRRGNRSSFRYVSRRSALPVLNALGTPRPCCLRFSGGSRHGRGSPCSCDSSRVVCWNGEDEARSALTCGDW